MKPLRINVGIDTIQKYLMNKIDPSNPVEVEKVGRYIKNIDMYRRMERTVKKEGTSIVIKNGSQTFIKAHPLLSEMNKVNASIMSIEKSFKFVDPDESGPTAGTSSPKDLI